VFYHGECEVSGWKLFDDYQTYEEERIAAEKKAEEERIVAQKLLEEARIAFEEREKAARLNKISSLNQEKSALEAELPTLKGLFKGGRRKEVEARLAEIEAELKKL
jgi:hypothetical protein